jgi:hypothetical protein
MSKDLEYHRTFERFSANPLSMWPDFKGSKWRLNYRGHDHYRREVEEAYAKKVGAFYATQRAGEAITRVRVMPKPDQEFWRHASTWEDQYSMLTSRWSWRVEPLLDSKLMVVGHVGWWWSREIFIPIGVGASLDVQSIVNSGDSIFACSDNPMPSHYRANFIGQPEWKFLLVTAPDGEVVGVLGQDGPAGAVSTIAPWEAIGTGRALIQLGTIGVRQVAMVVRRSAPRTAAIGATKEAAATASNRAAAATASRAGTEAGTIRAVHVGRFGEPGHVIARIEMAQGKVIYRVASIHLKAQGSAAEMAARSAHRDMMRNAAQEAQKRGQAHFTLRGIDANLNFRAHADKLAREGGVANSARILPGSTSGYSSYEVTLDAAKVLSKRSVKPTAKEPLQPAR